MKIPAITMPFFFKVGVGCFLVIGTTSLFNYISNVSAMNIPSMLGGAASIFFNFVTAGFFYYMYKQSGGSSMPDATSQELEELKQEFNGK